MSALAFSVRGSGQPVVLLHGFPFNSEIWNSFAEKLAKNFKVYTPDLPGFGESSLLSTPFSIEDVARSVIAFFGIERLENVTLVGHSLGGYVALSVADLASGLLSKLVLFHSTAYADGEEKKQSRNKVLDFIEKNGVVSFTSNFIEPLFADPNHPAISTVKSIAITAEKDTVAAYTLAMRDRPDKTSVLKNFGKPVLIVGGRKDAGISIESLEEQNSLSPASKMHTLEDVAHMGMFEKEGETLDLLSSFISK
jgi:pimeloyl-ACP methyl ester carboxylesterase